MTTMDRAWIFALLFAAAPAFAAPAGTVSFVEGAAHARHGGQRKALARGAPVEAGDEVSTGAGARLELTLADRSVVRLGPSSRFVVKEAAFGEGGHKKFTAKLLVGELWAKVAEALGGESRFDVETDNAVAGVRGTTFRVDAHRDRSVLVRVYAGAVAVASANRLPVEAHVRARSHEEVAGPQEVDKRSYEKLLAKMMEVQVSAKGELGEPRAFTAAAEAKDSWVAWNAGRDGE